MLRRGGSITKDLRINDRIRVREVRLIDDKGEQLGVVPTAEALRIANERGFDLVEVAPNASPPVCRLMDYGKFKYEQTKKEREARKNQKIVLLKEMRLRPKIDEHDLEFKTKLVQKFLQEGDKVKVTIVFRGRELAHPQLGRELLDTMADKLKGVASLERSPLMEGKSMSMILAPATNK
ncbi:MAG: translation initiation factor IF-3 [Chloroflexota bacterium]|jgi:translation initiation factor IF-3